VNATGLSERRYPYLTGAFASDEGRSMSYQRGPFGLKESFTHSPFDEVDALAARGPNATVGDGVRIERDGETYLVAIDRGAA
jgi:hypothetical protein